MNRNIRVRYHLGKGKNFMKWRIENILTKEVQFVCPNRYSLTLIKTKLYNQTTASEKIHCGGNKTVCAWIMCEAVQINRAQQGVQDLISYNPRVAPYWRDDQDNNIDKQCYAILFTNGNFIGQQVNKENN
jgi:hypothetical protein